MSLIVPSKELLNKVRRLSTDDKVSYILANICQIHEQLGTLGGDPSTPVAVGINVVDTVGGITLAAAVAAGQLLEIANVGEKTIFLRYDGGVPTAAGDGIPIPPGAVWTSPRPITTAVKAITAATESSLTFVHRLP